MSTTDIVMERPEFMERLAVLVPRPRLHLIRFHGVLVPKARGASGCSGLQEERGVADGATKREPTGEVAEGESADSEGIGGRLWSCVGRGSAPGGNLDFWSREDSDSIFVRIVNYVPLSSPLRLRYARAILANPRRGHEDLAEPIQLSALLLRCTRSWSSDKPGRVMSA